MCAPWSGMWTQTRIQPRLGLFSVQVPDVNSLAPSAVLLSRVCVNQKWLRKPAPTWCVSILLG